MRCCPEIQGHQTSASVSVPGAPYPAASTVVLHTMDRLGKYCTCRARACCPGPSQLSSSLRTAVRFCAGPVLRSLRLEILDSAQGRNLPAQGQHPSIARLTRLVNLFEVTGFHDDRACEQQRAFGSGDKAIAEKSSVLVEVREQSADGRPVVLGDGWTDPLERK
jgi:hypothetical protein